MREFSKHYQALIEMLVKETTFSQMEVEEMFRFLKKNNVHHIADNIEEIYYACKTQGLSYQYILSKWPLKQEENLKGKIDNWKEGSIYLKTESLDRPQSIKILGCIVKIEYIKDDDRSPNMGQCNNLKKIIRINEEMPNDTQHSVLLHEVIHYISHELLLKLTGSQVDVLASVLYPTLIDNPGILGWK
jgi:hypothetical protein